MVDAALDAGITSLDTANGYAADAHRGDPRRGPRGPPRPGVPRHQGRHLPRRRRRRHRCCPRKGIRSSLEASLRRLRTDHVDLFYLHQPDRTVPLDETPEALAEVVSAGLGHGRRRVQLRRLADRRDLTVACEQVGRPTPSRRPAALQPRRPPRRGRVRRVRHDPRARHHRLQPARRRPAHRPAQASSRPRRTAGSATPRLAAHVPRPVLERGTFDASTTLSTHRLRRRARPARAVAALAALASPWSTSVLLGGSKVEQMQANIAAARRGPLPEDVVAACDEVGAPLTRPDAGLQPMSPGCSPSSSQATGRPRQDFTAAAARPRAARRLLGRPRLAGRHRADRPARLRLRLPSTPSTACSATSGLLARPAWPSTPARRRSAWSASVPTTCSTSARPSTRARPQSSSR